MADDKTQSAKKIAANSIKIVRIAGENTLQVSWAWKAEHTASYTVKWEYLTQNGYNKKKEKADYAWYVGDKNTGVKTKYDRYSYPDNAIKVRASIKPVAEKIGSGSHKKDAWTAGETTSKEFNITEITSNMAPAAISRIIQKDNSVTVYVDSYIQELSGKATANQIQFELYQIKDTGAKVKSVRKAVNLIHVGDVWRATNKFALRANNGRYIFRVRAYNSKTKLSSAWSEWSNPYFSFVSSPSAFDVNKTKVTRPNAVYVVWKAVSGATGYQIQLIRKGLPGWSKNNWKAIDSHPSWIVDDQTVVGRNAFEFSTELGVGQYTARVRAFVEREGENARYSKWLEGTNLTIKIGNTQPSPPTTWSDRSVVKAGEDVTLYWMHNSSDSTLEKEATIIYSINGAEQQTNVITNSRSPYDDIEAHSVTLSSFISDYSSISGTIEWSCKTKGAIGGYSDESMSRSITIYEEPDMSLEVINGIDDTDTGTYFTGYPLSLNAQVVPDNQNVQTYTVQIRSLDAYSGVNIYGMSVYHTENEVIMSKTIISTEDTVHEIPITINAGDAIFENDRRYAIDVIAGMDSGLSCSDSIEFICNLDISKVDVDCRLAYDDDNKVALIQPIISDNTERYTIYVYRVDDDGVITPITDSEGLVTDGDDLTIIDPHCQLNRAYYRVAVFDNVDGISGFEDFFIDVDEPAIIITWDEGYLPYYENERFDTSDEDGSYGSSMLYLPYNIDVSYSGDKDVVLVEYIGRTSPVGYYGTQTGETATWNTEIPKDDVETIAKLRQLSRYQGDVYVREPSGVGYWASVNVSYEIKHLELTVPVTFAVTRVEAHDD